MKVYKLYEVKADENGTVEVTVNQTALLVNLANRGEKPKTGDDNFLAVRFYADDIVKKEVTDRLFFGTHYEKNDETGDMETRFCGRITDICSGRAKLTE